MANAFTRKPVLTTGGLGPEEWNRRFVYTSKFQGDVPVEVVDFKKATRSMPSGDVAILFRNPKTVRGCSFAYNWDPDFDLVPLVDAHDAHIRKRVNDDRVTGSLTVILPLGAPTAGNTSCLVLLRQAAREWVSGGVNNADMSDQHVISMYMHALSGLVFTLSKCEKLDQQKKWFVVTSLLMEAVSEFCNQCEEARKIVAALRDSELAEDMLQRSLAFAFAPLPAADDDGGGQDAMFALEDACRILEIAVKRNTKWGSMMVAGNAAGPMSCLVLVPLLRRFLNRKLTRDQMTTRFNQFVTELAEVMSKVLAAPGVREGDEPGVEGEQKEKKKPAGVDPLQLDTAVVAKMLEFSDIKIAPDKLTLLLKFAREPKNYKEPAPLEAWGIISKPKLSFTVVEDKIRSKGSSPSAGVSVQPRATSADFKERKEGQELIVNRMTVRSKRPTDWSAIGLMQDGAYVFTCESVGVADKAVGDVRGKELQALWRVTSGTEILRERVEGYSSAGKHHAPPGWGYPQKTPFSLDDACELLIEGDKITLTQKAVRAQLKRCDLKEPVLLAFKNLALNVTYRPLRAAPAQDEAKSDTLASEGDTAFDELAQANLTPVALLQQMSKLAIASSKNKRG